MPPKARFRLIWNAGAYRPICLNKQAEKQLLQWEQK